MAIEYTPEQTAELLTRLSAPFHPSEVKWRVIAKSGDNKQGIVAPYADPRAYHNRLNDVLTASGWSCRYSLNTLNGITRLRKKGEAPIATGKITAIASVQLFGISEKSSMGEMWADDENAVTRAEAQAFKRACAMFGLGRYLYEVKAELEAAKKLWVPLDEHGNPRSIPQLPAWALPADMRSTSKQKREPAAHAQAAFPTQASQAGPPPVAQKPNTSHAATEQDTAASKQRFEAERKQFESTLGQPLFANILGLITKMETEGKLAQDKYSVAYRKMQECSRTLEQVRIAAADLPAGALDNLLDTLEVSRFDLIPTHKALHLLAVRLGVIRGPQQQKAA